MGSIIKRQAWDLYYQDLPDFSKIRELMRQPLPHCFKRVPASPLSDLALDRREHEPSWAFETTNLL